MPLARALVVDRGEHAVDVWVPGARAEDNLVAEPADVVWRLELRQAWEEDRQSLIEGGQKGGGRRRPTRLLTMLLHATWPPPASHASRTTPKLPEPSTTSVRTVYLPTCRTGCGRWPAAGGGGARGGADSPRESESDSEKREASEAKASDLVLEVARSSLEDGEDTRWTVNSSAARERDGAARVSA